MRKPLYGSGFKTGAGNASSPPAGAAGGCLLRAVVLGFRVWGLEFRVYDLGFRVKRLGFRLQGLGFRE